MKKLSPNIFTSRNVVFVFFLMTMLFLLSACGGSGDTVEEPETSAEGAEILVNPYKAECEIDSNLQLCYVVGAGESSDFAPYMGEITGFDYEWGHAYNLRVTGDNTQYQVEEVLVDSPEPGGVNFEMVLTGGDGRIRGTSEGAYEFYGEKAFVCDSDADCDALEGVINRTEPISFTFQTPENPADPYVLKSWQSETKVAQVGEQPDLVGENWVLESVTVSKNETQPVIAGVTSTAVFIIDTGLSSGTVTGFGGCNSYTGQFSISGNTLTIKELEIGEAQCENPPGVMNQEQQFISALRVAGSYLVEDGKLQISYNSGESALNLSASE